MRAVVFVAAAAMVFFVGYRMLERVWRRRVLVRAARRILPVAPGNTQPPTGLEMIPYDGWLFIGPYGVASPCERRPPRTHGRRVTMPGAGGEGFYDRLHE